MALTKTTVVVNNIQALADTPSSATGLTTATFKAKFDQTGADLKTYINSTLTTEIDTALGLKANTADAQKIITSGTADPTGGSDNDIYIQYV